MDTGGIVVGSIIDGNRVTRDFPDDITAPSLDWAPLVKVKGWMGVGAESWKRGVGVAKWVEPERLGRGALLPGAIWLLGRATGSWVGPEKLNESRGIGTLRRGAEPGVGTGLMGVVKWVGFRRETRGTGLIVPGTPSRGAVLLPAFTLGVRVGVAA